MAYTFARATIDAKYQSVYDQIDFSSLEPDAEDAYLAAEADREYTFLLKQQANESHKQA
jgi:hypothetical protein